MSDTPSLDPEKVLAQAAAGLERDHTAASPAAPEVAELAPAFPGYDIRALVGRGGMGAVYRARHLRLDREVALKVLPKELAADPTFEERFLREARALARLDHPHVLRVFDFGEAGGWFYLVTEYVDGADLRQMMQLGKLSPEEALRLVPQVCEALHYAHGRGVVHRDIKPENILVDQAGNVKVADFGLAKLMGEAADGGLHLTQTRQVLGTPHYIAPEQVEQPTRVDHRADIFSLGVVLYEMLTGQLPIGRFPPPSQRSALSPQLDPVVMRSLEPEPQRRYQTVDEMRSDIVRGGTAGEPTEERLERLRQRRAVRRHGNDQMPGIAFAQLVFGVVSWGLCWALEDNSYAAFGTVFLVAASILGFRALSVGFRDLDLRLAAAVTSAWFPVLLVLDLVALLPIALGIDAIGVAEDSLAGWLWGTALVVDVAILRWLYLRLRRSRPWKR